MMIPARRFTKVVLAAALIFSAGRCAAQIVVNEFMARNDATLIDGDGNYSDWIELYNAGSNRVDLTGWYLSDNTNNLTAWTFPATSIAADDYLVVLASGQDTAAYTDSLGYLHTSFKLGGDGESVVLTQSDGTTVEYQIAGYPEQSDDISYGIPRDSSYFTLIAADEDAKALIPSNAAAGSDWHYAAYDDSGWLDGYQGVGYEAGSAGDYDSMIGLDVVAMQNVNGSVYVRIPFEVEDAASIAALSLRMKYDDGFSAFLNGVEIASINAPASLAYDSTASSSHEADDFEEVDVSAFAGALLDGTNVLAIQGLNTPTRSSDMLIMAELNAAVAGAMQTNTLNYLPTPTPGTANVSGFLGYVADTTFSVDRGFYTNAFDLEISCKTEAAEIFYTTDGTEPAVDNGTLYTAPVTVGKTTVLRAAAFVDGYQPSDVDTQTYIFLDDIVNQSADASGLEPYFPSGSVNGQVFDYEMDPDIVGSIEYGGQIKEALLDIPSISIVTDPENLFDSSIGIYVNAMSDGTEWERETSVELINPDGTDGFQINGGVRIRGGSSRSSSNPKHSFRLFFRSEYGTSRLNYKLFGDEGADSFKRMDLRTGQNFSWQYGSGGAKSTWLYDIFVRDAHREMGQPYTRGNYCHVYLNGLYWGLYQTEERPDARYGESYFGDDSDDYDIVKSGDNQGAMEATDGQIDAYQELWTEVNSGIANNADYFAIQGMNADGTENSSYTRLLDVDNVIDYMLTVFYVGNRDSPLGPPEAGRQPRNLFTLYNRTSPDGFKFIAHDAEHALGYHLDDGVDYNHLAERSASVASSSSLGTKTYFNPWWLHLELMNNEEYALRFADRVNRHLFNDGILTPEHAVALLNVRKAEMEMAIIAESARWGDYVTSTPRTKNDDWLPAVDDGILASYLLASPSTRRDVVFSQIEAQGWYPTVDAPAFSQHGGRIAAGFSLSISGGGTIYYTTDGSDPREIGGAVDAGAVSGSSIMLDHSAQVKARAFNNGEWSALTEATFVVDEASPLRVSEIMYNPAGTDPEFIEILNTGTETIGLAGTEFTEGITFDFTDGSVASLDPGEYAVLVNDYDAFTNRYANWASIQIAGQFHGKFFLPDAALANDGEDIAWVDGLGSTIQNFEYNDWYDATDGEGFSLTLIDPTLGTNTWSESSSWRASKYAGGTPGEGPEEFLEPGDLLINEALTHQDDDTPGDWVELYNASTNTLDINGWFLSDDGDDLTKVELSGLPIIGSGDYLVLTEAAHFGTAFALSELGEGICLSSGEGGVLTGFRTLETFGAAERDVTFGRHVKSDGSTDFTAQSAQSSGATNAYPMIGNVVFSEIMYHPADSNAFEFIELYNRTSSDVLLYDASIPSNVWKLAGAVEYSFPEGTVLGAGQRLVIAETDSAAFEAWYGVPAFGTYSGQLNNDGEELLLTRPGDPEVLTGEVPPIVVERVDFNDASPWPTAADGLGSSLGRIDTALYPNDAANWTANASPSPGRMNGGLTDPEADWDNDGSSNYDEYIAGTDPNDAGSIFAFQSLEVPSDCVVTWSSVTGKVYSLWVSTNLISGEFSLTNSAILATPPLNTYTIPLNESEFFCLKLTVEDE